MILEVTDVQKDSTTKYPVNWNWKMGSGDPANKFGEQKLCFKLIDNEVVDQRYSINVYYLRGEEPSALMETITPATQEEPAPMPGDDTIIGG